MVRWPSQYIVQTWLYSIILKISVKFKGTLLGKLGAPLHFCGDFPGFQIWSKKRKYLQHWRYIYGGTLRIIDRLLGWWYVLGKRVPSTFLWGLSRNSDWVKKAEMVERWICMKYYRVQCCKTDCHYYQVCLAYIKSVYNHPNNHPNTS